MFTNLINKIKTNFIFKKKFLVTKLKKNEINLLKKLIKLNIIKYIIKKDKKFILILNFLKKNKTIFNLKNMYTICNLKKLKLKNIKKMNNKNKILILTSNKGIINNFEAEKKGTGGILIMYI